MAWEGREPYTKNQVAKLSRGQMVLSSKEFFAFISAEKMDLTFYALKVEASNGIFPISLVS